MKDRENVSGQAPGVKGEWIIHAVLTAAVVYFYVLNEWLFFITKPSFMSKTGLISNLQILFVAPIPLVAAGIAGITVAWVPAVIFKNRILRGICSTVASLIPSLVLACSMLLLVENFTYTVFKFGIRMTEGVQKLAYGFLILVLLAFSYQLMRDIRARLLVSSLCRRLAYIATGVFAVSVLIAAGTFNFSRPPSDDEEDILPLEWRPNIIVISSDGLNASNMSAYGYDRETTPYITELAGKGLFCENCFVNSGTSGASIASMFTGKLPTRTRLLYAPDILRGEDAYQHLPGILRRYGYRNVDVSVRHHADPADLNMLKSFHRANFRDIKESSISDHFSLLLDKDYYFLRKMRERLDDRTSHLLGVRRMENPMREVVETKNKQPSHDKYRIDELFSFIDGRPSSPVFAHVHLLGTHGPKFRISNRHFSRGKNEAKPWMTDFYDDAILNFDGQMRRIIEGLEHRGKLDSTVIVICTDHGQRWRVDTRVPLIILFPKGEHRGRIASNVQNLDIAPTILDYLNIEQPEWMGGMSLLEPGIDPFRYIFTVTRKAGIMVRTKRGRELDSKKTGPPFYSIGTVGIYLCNRFYELDLGRSELSVSEVAGHTSPCSESDLPDPEWVGRAIIDHLADNDYDVSSIVTPLTVISAER